MRSAVTIVASVFVLALAATSFAEDVTWAAAPAGAGSAPAATEPDLEIRLSTYHALAPASVRALVRVRPHDDNRLLRVEVESGAFYRSSDIQLDGAAAARSHFMTWRSLPPGEYEVVVTTIGTRGVRARQAQSLVVIGPSE